MKTAIIAIKIFAIAFTFSFVHAAYPADLMFHTWTSMGSALVVAYILFHKEDA